MLIIQCHCSSNLLYHYTWEYLLNFFQFFFETLLLFLREVHMYMLWCWKFGLIFQIVQMIFSGTISEGFWNSELHRYLWMKKKLCCINVCVQRNNFFLKYSEWFGQSVLPPSYRGSVPGYLTIRSADLSKAYSWDIPRYI